MKNLVAIKGGKPVTTSRLVAEKFGRRHSYVLDVIKNLNCSKSFTELNFWLSEYPDPSGRRLPEYIMTKDGFIFLIMGFTGREASRFKEEYINAFNQMENTIIDGINSQAKIVEENIKRRYLLANEMQTVNSEINRLMKRHDVIKKEMRSIDLEDFQQLKLFPKYEDISLKSFPNR